MYTDFDIVNAMSDMNNILKFQDIRRRVWLCTDGQTEESNAKLLLNFDGKCWKNNCGICVVYCEVIYIKWLSWVNFGIFYFKTLFSSRKHLAFKNNTLI